MSRDNISAKHEPKKEGGEMGSNLKGRVAQTLTFVGWNRGILKEVTR